MSNTRFSEDPLRVKKQLQQQTFSGNYILSTPCPRADNFIEDPHIRLQNFGANMRTNTCDLESDLLGINRKLTREPVLYNSKTPINLEQSYGNNNTFMESQSRFELPSWQLRDLEQNRWDIPIDNIQPRVAIIPFEHSVSSRYESRWK